MGNRNIIGSSDYGVENNLYRKFLNPPNPLFQRGNDLAKEVRWIYIIK